MLPQEIEGAALLMATLEANGGDLRAAFVLLCRGVSPEEVAGEDFRAALSRAVTTLLERTAPIRRLPSTPANDL